MRPITWFANGSFLAAAAVLSVCTGQAVLAQQVLLQGIPDYQQNDFAGTNDCAPVAAANVLGYWDAHGFQDLISGTNDFGSNPAGVTALVDTLKAKMHWTPSGTQIAWIWIGIAESVYEKGYSFRSANLTRPSWAEIRQEPDRRRPAILTLYHRSYGAMHTVTLIGYSENTNDQVVVVHDVWYPANDVWLNFSECSELVLTAVAACLYVDDDAPGDPAPGDASVGDPQENGSPGHPFDSIQEAVDSAYEGITIFVGNGVYSGAGNHDIALGGKVVSIIAPGGPATCFIECGGIGDSPRRALVLTGGQPRSWVIQGFSIRGGHSDEGGGVYCRNASPTFRNCIFFGNSGGRGGAVFSQDSSPLFENCTIANNTAEIEGGGIFFTGTGTPVIRNCIIWGNAANQISPTGALVSFSNVAGGYGGDSIMDSAPFFAGDTTGDFHLKSRFGRYSPSASGGTGGWVFDGASSPCLDAGDASSPWAYEPEPNGGRVNLGAYGNTQEASLSGPWWRIPGDVNDDCHVNILDMIHIRNALGLDPSSGTNWKKDVNRDGKINVLDLIFVRNWSGAKCY